MTLHSATLQSVATQNKVTSAATTTLQYETLRYSNYIALKDIAATAAATLTTTSKLQH